MKIEELWYSRNYWARLVRIALFPLTAIYSATWEVYLLAYKTGFKRASPLLQPTVCIGNLVAGGTGKTPVTVFVAQCLIELGQSVVISCSGYGSPHSADATITPAGKLDPKKWGDEPSEIRDLMPNENVIVGRRRVLAAELAFKSFPDAVLLMDDGFQHLPVSKSVTIVLDPTHPNNAWPFPAGPYREPRWNRKRADLVLPNERFRVEYSPLTFWDPDLGLESTPESAVLLTAIGRPDLFRANVEEYGIRVLDHIVLADHDALDAPELFSGHNDRTLIVTMKDWVKLRERADLAGRHILVARRTASIEPKEEFKSWLRERIG